MECACCFVKLTIPCSAKSGVEKDLGVLFVPIFLFFKNFSMTPFASWDKPGTRSSLTAYAAMLSYFVFVRKNVATYNVGKDLAFNYVTYVTM